MRRALILLAGITLAACGVATLDEIVPFDEVQLDRRLEGDWVDTAGKESAQIVLQPNTGYAIIYTHEDGKEGVFLAAPGTLGGKRIFDIRPSEPNLGQSPLWESMLFPLHGLLVIEKLTATELHVRALESEALNEFLRREPTATPHYMQGGEATTILTAHTPELRRFLAEYIQRPGALSEVVVYVRKGP